jgi:hypothetical protein
MTLRNKNTNGVAADKTQGNRGIINSLIIKSIHFNSSHKPKDCLHIFNPREEEDIFYLIPSVPESLCMLNSSFVSSPPSFSRTPRTLGSKGMGVGVVVGHPEGNLCGAQQA